MRTARTTRHALELFVQEEEGNESETSKRPIQDLHLDILSLKKVACQAMMTSCRMHAGFFQLSFCTWRALVRPDVEQYVQITSLCLLSHRTL